MHLYYQLAKHCFRPRAGNNDGFGNLGANDFALIVLNLQVFLMAEAVTIFCQSLLPFYKNVADLSRRTLMRNFGQN